MQNDVSLVKNTRFEELVARIQSGQKSRVNMEQKYAILRKIVSVYFFLRHEYGMEKGPLSIQDYKTANETLMEMARERVRQWNYRMLPRFVYCNTAWGYFHTHSYFHIRRTPFGAWFNSVGYMLYYCPFGFLEEKRDSLLESNIVPTNIKELIEMLFEEQYGKNGGKNE